MGRRLRSGLISAQTSRGLPLLAPRERRQSIQLAGQPYKSSGDVFQDGDAILGNTAFARKSLIVVSMFSALSTVDQWLSLPAARAGLGIAFSRWLAFYHVWPLKSGSDTGSDTDSAGLSF
ncbi:hypothetical protein AB7M63_003588 [Bradyrhizobium japonicum]